MRAPLSPLYLCMSQGCGEAGVDDPVRAGAGRRGVRVAGGHAARVRRQPLRVRREAARAARQDVLDEEDGWWYGAARMNGMEGEVILCPASIAQVSVFMCGVSALDVYMC